MIRCFIFVLLCIIVTGPLSAAYTIRNGELVNVADLPKYPAQKHFNDGAFAMRHNEWSHAASQFRIVATNFPNTPVGQESLYYLGVAYYNMQDYDFANEAFSQYLRCSSATQYFEEAINYKFLIANQLRCGAKVHMFGSRYCPRWVTPDTLSVEIYDEIIATVPCHELAVQSLFIKACLLRKKCCYREGIDAYYQLIRRFPKHELAPKSYLAITEIYVEQAQQELQNSDILELAQVVVRKFEIDFPGEELIYEAECNLQRIKEIYACGLYETGRFYERTYKPCAAVLYYRKALSRFPDTRIAEYCMARMSVLDPCDYMTLPSELPPDLCEQ